MATYTAQVITLRATRIRDTEAVCHFFSAERGKIEASARGIGRPGSKLTPAIEPFTFSRAFFAQGRNLDHLTQAEVLEAFYALRTDLQRMGGAAFVVELIDKTTEPGEPAPAVFELLRSTLATLCGAPDPQLVTWAFEAQYLALIGLSPQMDVCVSCGAKKETDLTAFSPGLGGVLCRSCVGMGEERTICAGTRHTYAALRRLGPEGAQRLRLNPRVTRELSWLITKHRQFHIEADINSARFLSKLVMEPR
ncbi:MAG: DNA repair protein RecO [Candidatus Zipacnadales bacterium]